MTDYESFPIRTEFRDKLIAELGILALARKRVPEDIKPFVDEVYDNVAQSRRRQDRRSSRDIRQTRRTGGR